MEPLRVWGWASDLELFWDLGPRVLRFEAQISSPEMILCLGRAQQCQEACDRSP